MTEIKVILVDDESSPHVPLQEAFKEAGFQVTLCLSGFHALDELGSQGADCVVAAVFLPDLTGYQLSSLIKSTERTHRLPIVLLANEESKEEEFWNLAALADVIYSIQEAETNPDHIVKEIRELVEDAKSQGWKPSLAKNLFMPLHDASTPSVKGHYFGLIDNLLIERLVTRLTRNLSLSVEPRTQFAEAYFGMIEQVFQPDLLGIVISSPEESWAAYQVTDGLSRESFEQLSTKVSKQIGGGDNIRAELAGTLKDGGKAIVEYEILPVQTEKGQGALVFGSTRKKSFDKAARAFMTQLQMQMHPVVTMLLIKHQQEIAEERDAHRASTDPLTGLYNLEFLIGFLQQQLLFSYRQRLAVGMAIVDIDNLQEINEEYGTEMGDIVITTIANRLLTITRSSDLIARYGGDEFAVVLPNTDLGGVKVLGEKVRLEVEQMGFAKQPGRKSPQVTVSIGCSIFNMEDLNPETILGDAKAALQKAKETGRNKVTAAT
jgi:two-component system cell cycle response regulator